MRTLEIPLINSEFNLILTWSENWVASESNSVINFAIADTKPDVLAVYLSTQDNTNLLKQLKSGFKFTVNWNKFQSKVTTETRNQYLDYLIWSKFSGSK